MIRWFVSVGLLFTVANCGNSRQLETFSQPRDALLLYSEEYGTLYEGFVACAEIACGQETFDKLIARRDQVLVEQWPDLHAALTNPYNWDYKTVMSSFFILIGEAGGIEKSLTDCVPAVRWHVTGNRGRHYFDGLTCNGKFIKMTT